MPAAPTLHPQEYRIAERIGKGGQSNVYRGIHISSGETVAIKKMSRFQEVDRELQVLQALNDHPNVVVYMGYFHDKANICLVFEYLQMDMGTLLSSTETKLTEAQARTYMRQVLNGLSHLHSLGIIHRDIKLSNLLVSLGPDNLVEQLKISDFGVALLPNAGSPVQFLQEGTLIYQAPELLFGLVNPLNVHHVDTWAAGCVLAEFVTGRHLFYGDKQLSMLQRIFAVLDSPTEDTWPGVTKLRCYLGFQGKGDGLLNALGKATVLSQCFMDLLAALLTLDPSKRISSDDALQHPFFDSALPEEHLVYVPPQSPAPSYSPGPVVSSNSPGPVVPSTLFADLSPGPMLADNSPMQPSLLMTVPVRGASENRIITRRRLNLSS